MPTATQASEVCPECGNFVLALHEVSGFCSPCSEELGYGSISVDKLRAERLRQHNARARLGLTKEVPNACIKGHRYYPGNYTIRKDGILRCRECDRINSRNKRIKLMERMGDLSDPQHGKKAMFSCGCKCKRCNDARETYNEKRRGKQR